MELKPHNFKSRHMQYKRFQHAFLRKASVVALALVMMAAVLMAMRFNHSVTNASAAFSLQNDQPTIGPGIPHAGSNAPKSGASNTKPASVLFFPKYTSDAANPSNVNTLISLTNANPRDAVTLRLFFVRDCQVHSMFLNLAGNQTRTLLTSSEDPGKTGYLVVVPVNAFGIPTQFNWLIGSASLRDANGHEASYNAIGVAKRTGGAVSVQEGATTAQLKFNDTEFDRLPQLVALDRINNQDPNAGEDGPIPADKTDVTLISPLANLAGGAQALEVTAIAYDQSGRPYPQIVSSACGLSRSVNGIWSVPSLNSFITPDRAGWANFSAQVEGSPVPLIGLTLNNGTTEKYRSARLMQALNRLASFNMTMPIVAPPIAANDVITTNQPDATGNSIGASEIKAGSALVFARFASGMFGDSRLYITNTHPTQKARVRVFFSGMADSTAMNETIISLFPNQTTELNPNDLAPNQKGWVMATAIDNRYLPLNFNFLIGSARVKDQNGNSFGYNALAIAKNSAGALPRNEDLQTATISFDDENYDRLPSSMAVAGLPSQVDNTTLLGYARPPASMLDPVNTRGAVLSTVIDDLLVQASATIGAVEVRVGLVRGGNITSPPIASTILKGHRGWMKLAPGSPIFAWINGTSITPFATQPDSSNWTGGIGGGVTLHALTLTDSFQLKTLSTNPNNHAPTANFESIDFNTEARAQNGTIVRLDGRISTDPDVDDPLTYKWYDGDKLISTAAISDYRLSIGTHAIKLIVTDGNSLSSEPLIRQVDVRDTTPPVISGVPSKITRTTGSNVGVTVNYPLPVAYDAVDGIVSVTSSKLPGFLFPVGITTVMFTARDNSGNVATASMQVEIKKGTATFPQSGGVAGNKLPAMNSLNDQYVV
ncbi:MAG: HYR domain-containing protein, partial [Acidobacteria bacterium]|nr:HYR domain-containing protein [Acidobacteriota bacterium]